MSERFRVGDNVVIVGSIVTHYLSKVGVVMDVQPAHTRVKAGNMALEKYLVKFSDADHRWFFDTQLDPADPIRDNFKST